MLVELVMVMLLLALFGTTIYTLIVSGADTQARITARKDAQADARVALSYINVRLRQNDAAGKIAVEPLELTGENAIVIRERGFDFQYDTWIFCSEGTLYECLTDPGVPPSVNLSFSIVDAEKLETELEPDGSVRNTLYYKYGEELREMSAKINLRSQ
jgi:type II secretory pathway pseudopilin PulG